MRAIVRCFSTLVAAGQGERCEELRESLRDLLLAFDSGAGMTKLEVLKNGRRASVTYRTICLELERCMSSQLRGVNDRFKGHDDPRSARMPGFRRRNHRARRAAPMMKLLAFIEDSPLMLDAQDERHLFFFRRALEWSMTYGMWNGTVGTQC